MGPQYEPLLPGIAFGGYRSFAKSQKFLFPTKVTVLAGVNNSGKSNVLRFLQDVLPTLGGRRERQRMQMQAPTLSDLDRPRGFEGAATFEIGFPTTLSPAGTDSPQVLAREAHRQQSLPAYQNAVMRMLSDDGLVYWSRYATGDGATPSPSADSVGTAMALWPDYSATFRNVLDVLGGGTVEERDVMTRLLESIPIPLVPTVVTIAGSRRVEAKEGDPDWSSGQGIIGALAKLQNPTHGDWEQSQSSWQAINRFVQTVLGDTDVRLNVPHDLSTIQVATAQRVLPLSNLGSGVEQVVVLAAAATVVSKTLVCVEEPETNLHPLLQKKLLRYLTDETDNQYVIATHSSHFLDDSRATAYNVRLTVEGTQAQVARRQHELVQICNDLGYRPSDLQQANCVIWVEGPSDRTYVRRWLELVDPVLAEGIDYSVMFYGGRLLSHLSVSEGALNDFISLRRLNQVGAVLIDSDRTGPRKRINATKQRICLEFSEGEPAPGLAWVTDGYTVENYIPADVLTKAVGQIHPTTAFESGDKWTNPFPKREKGAQFDKIAIAQAVAELLEPRHLDVRDLRKQVTALRDFIRTANGHSIAPAQ
ncbi:putative AbiEii toxin of type IV toxin-antitoxin system [Promicromonospora sp. AC04]|uniref:AAA family ATPase n=1 Tax=Promicromonospora sp. AC04 TaxID=2135723 RepID=UPI000D45FF44|nr:AAA family ATPase [Promicromonospora sp. AC04]PUB25470.1 putative AbiEii toxin of type IV toxin-antitoxin system [Promicromonospora sp. AC04]